MTDFHELPTAILENGHIRLEYLTTAGPRIVGLSYHGSSNLLADVHDMSTDTPLGKYNFLGGHRLWISPESIEKTYIPDGSGLQVERDPNGVTLTGLIEQVTGVRKSIQIELEVGRPVVRLVHTIVNAGSVPIMLAPWAITMFKQGGTLVLPQPVGNTDPQGLLANRFLELWPYTRINDPRLVLRDDFILLHAKAALPPIKLGYASTAGWMAYWFDGILFRKSFDLHPGAAYPDGGCNAETYCGDRFVELETLGALVSLSPGESTQLTETWEVLDGLDVPFIPPEIRKII